MIEPLLGRQFILPSTLSTEFQQSFKRKKNKKNKKNNLYTKLANMWEEIEFRMDIESKQVLIDIRIKWTNNYGVNSAEFLTASYRVIVFMQTWKI